MHLGFLVRKRFEILFVMHLRSIPNIYLFFNLQLMLWVVCASVSSSDENRNGFIQPLDFQSFFNNKESGKFLKLLIPSSARLL